MKTRKCKFCTNDFTPSRPDRQLCSISCSNKLAYSKRPKKLKKVRLTLGVGINDADYVVQPTIDGKEQTRCKIYACWSDMLTRCYSKKKQKYQPTYIGCTVDERWHSFMSFREWMLTQDWEGKHLDKDILIQGNKTYSPESCVFVTPKTNTFLLDRSRDRGEYPIGVSIARSERTRTLAYAAYISNGGEREYLGSYPTPEVAHQVWYNRKRELAVKLAEEQSDPRVAAALIARFP